MPEKTSRGPESIGQKHYWFAWYPVYTAEGNVWLKTVVRQRWERSEGRDIKDLDEGGDMKWYRVGYWRYGLVGVDDNDMDNRKRPEYE